MILSFDDLKKITKGAIYFEEKNGYFIPYRYAKKQLDYMARPEYDYGWRFRAKISGGIHFDFYTEATFLSLDYIASHTHIRSNTVDLYIDGEIKKVYYIENKRKGSIYFDLPKGNKRVTVFFPCESRLSVKNVTLDKGFLPMPEKSKKLLILGDSITQGAGPRFSSGAYVNILARELDFEILPQGVGGYRYEPCDLMRIDGFEPDAITVFLGTNYYEKSCLERCNYDYAEAVKEYYRMICEMYKSIPITVVTPLWRNNGVDMERLLWCIDTIKNEASKYENVRVLDGFKLMPNVDECLADGVHPNEYGSVILAKNLSKHLKEIKL